MPLVSVIVPAYNAEKTIFDTLQSILSQTFQDLEVIVIDDGSTDGTLRVVQAIEDSRVKAFSFQNGGVATARNRGIARAAGTFLSFIDSDDLWVTTKLEKQVEALNKNPQAGAAYSWTLIMDAGKGSFYPGNCESFEGDVYAQLLLSNFVGSGSNMLMRREAIDSIGGFDSSLQSHEDWDYYLRLAKRWPFAAVREPQILYRKRETSKSSNFEVMEKYIFTLHKKVFAEVPAHLQGLEPQSQAKKYEFLSQLALTHTYSSSWQDCRRALRTLFEAVRLHPPLLRTRRFQILLFKLVLTVTLTPKVAGRALDFLLSLRSKRYMSAHPALVAQLPIAMPKHRTRQNASGAVSGSVSGPVQSRSRAIPLTGSR